MSREQNEGDRAHPRWPGARDRGRLLQGNEAEESCVGVAGERATQGHHVIQVGADEQGVKKGRFLVEWVARTERRSSVDNAIIERDREGSAIDEGVILGNPA